MPPGCARVERSLGERRALACLVGPAESVLLCPPLALATLLTSVVAFVSPVGTWCSEMRTRRGKSAVCGLWRGVKCMCTPRTSPDTAPCARRD